MSLAKWSVSVFYTSLNIPIKNKKTAQNLMKCEGADSRRAGCLHELAESDGGDFSVLFFSTQKFQTEIHEIYREEKLKH